jgi:hypothetical protein
MIVTSGDVFFGMITGGRRWRRAATAWQPEARRGGRSRV